MQPILKSINNDLKFKFRPDSWDDNVIRAVASGKEYGITPQKDDVVVDIGGHIGSYTCLSAYHGAKVDVYEPVKDNYDLLKENLSLNELKATTNNKAVVGKDREVRMEVNKQNMGSSHIADKGVKVKTITFDEVMAKHKHIDILKMDCEGEEHAFNLVKYKDKIKTIVAEIHNDENLTLLNSLRPYYHVKGKKSNAKSCYMLTATRK